MENVYTLQLITILITPTLIHMEQFKNYFDFLSLKRVCAVVDIAEPDEMPCSMGLHCPTMFGDETKQVNRE